MKNSSFTLLLLFIGFINMESAFGQSKGTIKNSFVIHGASLTQVDLDFFRKSIEASDFEQFRLQTEPVLIKFKNGFNLELISAKDLVARSIKSDLDVNGYTNYPATADYKYPLFEILSSGWIVGAAENSSK